MEITANFDVREIYEWSHYKITNGRITTSLCLLVGAHTYRNSWQHISFWLTTIHNIMSTKLLDHILFHCYRALDKKSSSQDKLIKRKYLQKQKLKTKTRKAHKQDRSSYDNPSQLYFFGQYGEEGTEDVFEGVETSVPSWKASCLMNLFSFFGYWETPKG